VPAPEAYVSIYEIEFRELASKKGRVTPRRHEAMAWQACDE